MTAIHINDDMQSPAISGCENDIAAHDRGVFKQTLQADMTLIELAVSFDCAMADYLAKTDLISATAKDANEQFESLLAPIDRIMDQMAEIPSTSPAGFAAKAHCACMSGDSYMFEQGGTHRDDRLLESLLRDLVRLYPSASINRAS